MRKKIYYSNNLSEDETREALNHIINTHSNKIRIYLYLNQLDEAEREYQTCKNEYSFIWNRPKYLLSAKRRIVTDYGDILVKNKEYEEVYKQYWRALRYRRYQHYIDDFLVADLYFKISESLKNIKERYEEAMEEKQRAIELEPENAGYHASLGVTLHEMKYYEKSLEEKQKAVELEPDNAEYHHNQGLTFYVMGRYEDSKKESEKALKIDPDNARYHESLGMALHKMGCFEEALKEKQKAKELKPDNARYHANVGVTLYAMERFEEALKEVEQALEMEPENKQYLASKESILSAMKSDIETNE